MRAALLLAALVAMSGCSNTVVKASFNSNLATPPPPATVSGGQASVRVVSTSGGAAFASMLFFGTLLAIEDSRSGSALTGSTYLYEGFWARLPELDPERRVSEQDCTRPVDYTLGNIRCK